MEDKTLHAAIAAQINREAAKRNRLSLQNYIPKHARPERIKTRPEPLPPLKRPKFVNGPLPGNGYNITFALRHTREGWWRFKRAAYAQGKHAGTMLREMMQKVVDDYEATL